MSPASDFRALRDSLDAAVVGQRALVERLLIALLADGHLLVEGPPGLAKTRAVKALADRLDADYRRVQFTPDLLPSDLTGTEVYRPHDGSFTFQPGPLFANVVLADEINRAPAKVQSALLEAMAERQVSVGNATRPLPAPFLVMATRNPIEQEGTYPLPEAQLDRFLLHVRVDYPDAAAELDILRLVRGETRADARADVRTGARADERADARADVRADAETDAQAIAGAAATPVGLDKRLRARGMSLDVVSAARREVLDVHVAPAVEDYVVRLVSATRAPERVDAEIARLVQYGASPRGTLAIDAAARAHAWLDGRDYTSPADVQGVAHDALRHRLVLSFEAEADGVEPDEIVDRLLDRVAIP